MQEPFPPQEQVHLISEGELCLDLINSEHYDYRGRAAMQDNLMNPAWLATFVQHWHLPVSSPPHGISFVMLRALRTLLRQMCEMVAYGQAITDAQIEELNAFLRLTPVIQQAQRGERGIRLYTVMPDESWTAVISQVAASWADLLARVAPERVKVCANSDCHWVFVDASHNGSRSWCRQWACGNLMKVRQFRARTRGKSEE